MSKKTRKIVFGLLALTIVLALAAAIVIPNLVRMAYMSGVEPPGPRTVRTLMTAEIQYQYAFRQYTFDINALGGTQEQCNPPTSAHACLIDEVLANSSPAQPKSGYYFGAGPGPDPQTFFVWGIPLDPRNKAICGIDDGVLRVDTTGSNKASTSYAACKALPAVVN